MNRLLVFRLALVLLVVHSVTAFCLAGHQTPGPDLGICHYSDRLYDDDASLMRRREAPTHFRLMPSRYVSMVQAARGYQCTRTVTVGFNGHHYMQTGTSDDPGMMELIPTISRLIGMSIANTYDMVMLAVICSGVLIGYCGFWRLYPDRRLRGIGVAVFLCLGIAEARVADVYLFQISPLIAGIPWLLHLGLGRKHLALTVTAAVLAFCCSWCSLVRSGSIVICMTFLLTMFAIRYRIQKSLLPLLLVFLVSVPSALFERSLITRRDTALAKVGETAGAVNSHALWHTLYIGLGFIPNTEIPEYRDGVAADRVRSIDPSVAYTSAKYQAILRGELWSLVKRRPMLVIGILAAKAGIVIFLASILLYPARRLIFAEKSALWLDAAFVLTIAMSAMNGIVAVPRASYLLTFLCLCFLYTFIKLFNYHAQQKTLYA
jgi:hypothetical protein